MMTEKKTTVSVAIIAMNEADRIARMLKSVQFANEIIVIDSGSTDGTQKICGDYGAKVIYNPWPGYAGQRNFAADQTSSEWILHADADEAVSEELAKEIVKALQNAAPEVSAFSMPRLAWYLGRWIRHSGWYPDRKVRLVRKNCGVWQGGLHETLMVNGRTERLTQPLYHYTYRGIWDHVVTSNKFSDIYAKDRGAAEAWFVLAGVIHAIGKFLECYMWKLGILDGIPGLIIAVNSAWYIFLKHAKAWELSLDG